MFSSREIPLFVAYSALLATYSVGVRAQCETSTETNLAVAATLSDYSQFRASMDSIYSTASDALTGATVYVWTTLEDSPEGSFTAYGVYDADALTSAGFSITTETAYITACSTAEPTEETGSLPPSPTGQVCTPHEDHWHCDEPAETGAESTDAMPTETGAAECEPHGDHWHCPEGVSEPTTPPAAMPTETGAAECEPHGDHWHCPEGVPEPTSPPEASTITSAPASTGFETTATDTSSPVTTAPPPQEFPGGALSLKNGGGYLALLVAGGMVVPALL